MKKLLFFILLIPVFATAQQKTPYDRFQDTVSDNQQVQITNNTKVQVALQGVDQTFKGQIADLTKRADASKKSADSALIIISQLKSSLDVVSRQSASYQSQINDLVKKLDTTLQIASMAAKNQIIKLDTTQMRLIENADKSVTITINSYDDFVNAIQQIADMGLVIDKLKNVFK